MGAWGVLAFDNDTANDWADDLEEASDLTAVESALEEVEQVGTDYLDQEVACVALAACEVLARLRGKPGYNNAYTETVDTWVATHRITPNPKLLARASAVVDRVLAKDSELAELWEGSESNAWRQATQDLRDRLVT